MAATWFVGLPVAAESWFARLPPLPGSFRSVHPEDLHLTVAFLGSVAEEAAYRAFATLAPPPAFDIALGAVVPLGPEHRYSALGALVEQGRQPLEAWIASVRDPLLAAAGARPDRYGIKAHATLARPARNAAEADRAAGLAWARSVDLSAVRLHLDRVALYTRSEDSSARQYRIAAIGTRATRSQLSAQRDRDTSRSSED